LPFGLNIRKNVHFYVNSVEKFLLHAAFSAWDALAAWPTPNYYGCRKVRQKMAARRIKVSFNSLNNYFINQK